MISRRMFSAGPMAAVGGPLAYLAGFELGHGTHNLTVPIGLEAKMNTEDGSLRFREPAVHEGH